MSGVFKLEKVPELNVPVELPHPTVLEAERAGEQPPEGTPESVTVTFVFKEQTGDNATETIKAAKVLQEKLKGEVGETSDAIKESIETFCHSAHWDVVGPQNILTIQKLNEHLLKSFDEHKKKHGSRKAFRS